MILNYPIVFDKFENVFTSLGLAILENAKNVKIKTVINGEYTLSLILPRNDPKWQHVLEENFILVDGQLFRIRVFEEQRDNTGKLLSNIQCEQVWYDSNDCKFIPDFSMIGSTPRQILEAAYAGTRYTVGTVDASLANTDIEIGKTNPAAITNKLIENVGGEIERDNYTISLRARLGNNNGVQFRTGKNNIDLKKTTDSKHLCTRLYIYGTDDLDITSVNNGEAYIDSQYIDNYDYIHTRYIDYRDVDDPEKLKNKGLAEFSTTEKDGVDKPKVTYEVSVVELKKLSDRQFETFSLGDTVRIIDEDLNIDVNARIMEYEYYPFDPQRSSVVLANSRDNIGKLLASLTDARDRLNTITNPAGKVKVAWFENIVGALQTEINEGLTKKVATHDYGDIWVDNIENPTKAMCIVNGMFAIANTKKENGDWNWRVFGSGDGFTADLINAGVIRLADTLYIENATGTTRLNTDGIEIIDPEKAKAILKTGQIALQAWDPTTGTWVNGLYFDIISKKYVFDGTLSAAAIEAIKANINIVVSNTIITETISAQEGNIARLTVDELNTSDKVQRYLADPQDTSDVNYIRAYDQFIEFIAAGKNATGTAFVYNRSNQQLYWTDETKVGITTDVTDYPITIFDYTEVTKMKLGFEWDETLSVYIPKMTLGGGTDPNNPTYGKGYIYKNLTGLLLKYVTQTGVEYSVEIGENGVFVSGIDSSAGLKNISFHETLPDVSQVSENEILLIPRT